MAAPAGIVLATSKRSALGNDMGMIMSTVLTRGVRHEAQEALPALAQEKWEIEGVSSQMIAFACIWTAVIAYFALQAAFN